VKILQLTHDWKWTGPAEPMLRLALAQRERGHEVFLACPEPPPLRRSLASEARAVGLEPAVVIEQARGVRPLADLADVRALRGLLLEERIDIVHTWHTRDHILALRATRGLCGKRQCKVVRSYRIAERITGTPWNRWLFGLGTDGLLCVSPEVAQCNRSVRAGGPCIGAFGAVDFERFHPAPPKREVREKLGFTPDHHIVGIVARMQPHRRFDLLLEAAKLLFASDPLARLLVVGRGTHRERVAIAPAKRMGIDDRICFAGYIEEAFANTLRTMDVLTFLVPGSDGTCRAVLEAAACGVPAVTTRRGALPEIVLDGETGFCVAEDPHALAQAWGKLLGDSALRVKMGNAAAMRARECFSPEVFCDHVEALYREVCVASRRNTVRETS